MSGLSSIVTNPYLILLLICHLLSDYYFQSQKMADRKDQDKKVLGLHIPASDRCFSLSSRLVVDLLGHFTDSCWNRFLKTDRAEWFEITNRLDLCLGSSLAYWHLDVSSPFRSEEWFDLSTLGHFKSNLLCPPSWKTKQYRL